MMKKLLVLFGILLLTQNSFAQSWVQRSNFGGTGRHRAAGFDIGNKGYLGLGHVNGSNVNVIYKDWWEYDPASDSWTQKTDYPTPSGNYGAIAFSTSTRGYIGGGATLGSEFFEYNPQTNTWSAIANCPGTPTDQASFSVNDKGYVIQGNLLWEYDPATDVWTAKQNSPFTFTNWCCAFSLGGSGFIKNGSVLYEYKPLQDTWVQRATFPGLAYNGAGAFTQNNKGYIVTGYINSLTNVTSEVWEFNPGNNTWTQKTDFIGTSRRFSVAFSINNRAYMGTGTNGINFNDFWEMVDDVSTNELTQATYNVTVFPNPAVDRVEFSATATTALSGQEEIVLYNLSGELVAREQLENHACTLLRGDRAAGIYFYEWRVDGRTVKTGKLIFN